MQTVGRQLLHDSTTEKAAIVHIALTVVIGENGGVNRPVITVWISVEDAGTRRHYRPMQETAACRIARILPRPSRTIGDRHSYSAISGWSTILRQCQCR